MAPYDETLRVPLYIFAGQQVPMQRGQIRNDWVSHVDYLPTFVALGGGTTPSDIDGKSITHLLRGNEERHRSEIFFSYQGGQLSLDGEIPLSNFDSKLFGGLRAFFYDVPTHLGLKRLFRSDSGEHNFKLILWPQRDAALFQKSTWNEGVWELYDLARDPFEMHNLLATRASECAPLLAYLQQRLEHSFQCRGEQCWGDEVEAEPSLGAAADLCE
jgi:arylsulfatase A-like enzyme